MSIHIDHSKSLEKREIPNDIRALRKQGLHPLVNEQRAKDIWILLLVYRCINALCVRTFFQPDEYFQSLEPAWQMAFGPESGAWITWEWHRQLRSSLHPALFGVVYYTFDKTMEFLQFYPQFRAMILAVLPNLVQAYFAALGDFYTWQLSEKIYGVGNDASWATLLMTMLSPWQWFCSTRTFSNCLETTMTITALNFWPWSISTNQGHMPGGDTVVEQPKNVVAKAATVLGSSTTIKHLRISLLLAATACILRPTNALIWFCILMPVGTSLFTSKFRRAAQDYQILAREIILCGTAVLIVSSISDRLYFREWTFPPYQWLNFNISQDLAVFYGRNDWHYYLSQGLPLLLTTYLPFALVGLWKSTALPGSYSLSVLSTAIFFTLAALSLISHKEVRFIYPLLPLLHIIAAPVISSSFSKVDTTPTTSKTTEPNPSSLPTKTPKRSSQSTLRYKPLFALLLFLNLIISIYTTAYHQSGVVSIIPYLRHTYETSTLTNRGVPTQTPNPYLPQQPFVAFLTPCHSTPWRSQLYHSSLTAWALTCEPPIHLLKGTVEREEYRDEADRFYDDPVRFLGREIGKEGSGREWPRFLVGFEGVESSLREFFEKEEGKGGKKVGKGKGGVKESHGGRGIKEVKRFWNSHWHDDWRRSGDLVVWEIVTV